MYNIKLLVDTARNMRHKYAYAHKITIEISIDKILRRSGAVIHVSGLGLRFPSEGLIKTSIGDRTSEWALK